MKKWLVFANKAACNIYEDERGQITQKYSLENPEAKEKTSEIFSDRSGTAMTSATSNQAAISETHFYEELNRRFANEINSVLEKEKGQGHYDNLALISGPEFMGHMRNSMSKNVSAVVSEELVKNVFPMSVNEVKEFSKGL